MIIRTAISVLLLLLISFPAWAEWKIDHERSRLVFEATQMGAVFTGTFPSFDGDIFFDPENLENSHVRIVVNLAAVDTQSTDRDQYILMENWLYTESFPESVFETIKFEKKEENQYLAHANLTIRGVTLPVRLPFSLFISTDEAGNKLAKMEGNLTLNRLAYGVGQGEWEDTKMVGNPVIVSVSLTALENQ